MPNTTNIRSEQFNEVISNNPSFLVRNGIAIFVLLLTGILCMCSFIKYPDIITAPARLTAINPPKEIKAKLTARLVQLTATEGSMVKQGTVLGFLESTANQQHIIKLSRVIDNCLANTKSNQINMIVNLLNNFIQTTKQDENNGELQANYQTFIQAYQLYLQYLSNGFYLTKLNMLQKDMNQLQQLKTNLVAQRNMTEEDIKLMQQNFAAQEKMSKEKVIADVEYRNEKSKLLNKEMQLPQLSSTIINNENAQLAKQKEIAELQNQIAQQHNIFLQALQTFKAQIDDWKTKYLLVAPIDGIANFATFIQQNQMLQANQTICFINPTNSSYYAEVYIPQNNLGKIAVQQNVLLKFLSYPFQQYGYVQGKLKFISNITTDSGYLAKVTFKNGLQTNYKKQIIFKEGLKASAEIITEDMSLLNRFFYNIRSSFKK